MHLTLIRPQMTLDVSNRVVIGPYGQHYTGTDFDVHSVTIRYANQGGITVVAYDITKQFWIAYYETAPEVKVKGTTRRPFSGYDTLKIQKGF